MSVIYKGEKITRYDEVTYRQDEGRIVKRTEKGIPSTIYPRARKWQNAGWDVVTSAEGPYVTLVATRNHAYQPYPFIERWVVTTETMEKSLYALPKVMEDIESYTGAKGRAGYVKMIEDAVKEEDPTAYPTVFSADLIAERKRGVESYETEYTVVSRTLTFDFQHPPSEYDPQLEMRLDPIKYIYTKAQLGAPADVLFTLPDEPPSVISETMWGYRIREQSAEITNATTGMHRTSWVYAQWSTLLYTPKI